MGNCVEKPNRLDNTIIWSASLSLKQANKHSKINKQNTFIFTYPTLKVNWKIARLFSRKIMHVWQMPKDKIFVGWPRQD